MSDLYLGIDSGTQGSKVVILDAAKGTIVAEAYAGHELIECADGTREQDPAWWRQAIGAAMAEALKRGNLDTRDVRAIGVSGQQHGFVPLDADGEVIRPAKLWCDTATAEEARELTARLGGEHRVLELTGNAIAVGFTASKIFWLKKHEPKNYARLATILLPHDYINYWLTGECKTECGDASGTAYFDVRHRRWCEEVLLAIDGSGRLRDCLPELIASEQPVGRVLPEIAQQFGFEESVLVASGGGDNMMAAIGTGNVAPGVVTASLGTSGTIYCFSEKPVVDEQGELAAFCSSDGHWLPLVCTMNVTVATELTRNMLGLDIDSLNREAGRAAAGADGLLLLPYFNGERTPALPDARATLFGLTSTNYTPANLCRAAMEGATFGLRYGLEVMRRNGIAPAEIRLVGGGARSRVWRKIVADIFNCPVVCPATQEAGALGAALQAMWCHLQQKGETVTLPEITEAFVALDAETRAEPDTATAQIYAERYEAYLRLDQQMRAMY